MALTRDFRETVQARVKHDAAFRKGLLRDAVESLLAGEVALGKELLRGYINATVGFPKLAKDARLHVKSLHQMFGPKETPPPATYSKSWPTCNGTKEFDYKSEPAAHSVRLRNSRSPTLSQTTRKGRAPGSGVRLGCLLHFFS